MSQYFVNPFQTQNLVLQQLATISNSLTGNLFLPEAFGAVGNGVTDDTAAIQAAVNAALTQALTTSIGGTVYLPQTYFISSTISVLPASGVANFGMIGRSKAQPTFITTTANLPFITFNSTNGNIILVKVSNMQFVGNGSQTGIKFTGLSGTGYGTFDNLFFNTMTQGFMSTSPATSDGNDWNQFSNITCLNCTNGFNLDGWGTGTVYNTGNLVLNGAGSGFLLGSATSVTGDLNIIGWQMGGSGTGITINGGSYGGNIGVSQCQFDAGISPGFNLKNVHQMEAKNINYGGAVVASVIDLATTTDLRLDEDRTGYVTSGTTTVNDWTNPTGQGKIVIDVSGGNYTITGLGNGYDGREMTIYNGGSANSVILRNENTGSLANNRLHIGADTTLTTGQSFSLKYVGQDAGLTVSNRWITGG